ncbi:MAG: chaperone modulator CbpM [Gammaproteobacteria bacterium]
MAKQEIVIMTDYSDESLLSLTDVCRICSITPAAINQLAAYDIIQLNEDCCFNLEHLSRIQQSLRLQRDLEVNLAGVAIILNLMDDMRKLEMTINLYKKHY